MKDEFPFGRSIILFLEYIDWSTHATMLYNFFYYYYIESNNSKNFISCVNNIAVKIYIYIAKENNIQNIFEHHLD